MEADGLRFEDFEVGAVFEGGPRQITRADIDAFTVLSGDRTALHSDDAYASTTPLGGVVAHGALVLAAATGLAYGLGIFDGTVLAVRSMDVAFERPVRPDDRLTLKLSVADIDARPRPDRGRVRFDVEVANQDGRTVMSGLWELLIRRVAGTPAGS